MTTSGSYADVNGLSLYYEIHGEGAPLLLLHGGTCSIELPSMEIRAGAVMCGRNRDS
jgi:hypothetical protein